MKDIFRNIVLEDDNTSFGGTSHAGETLGEFMDEVGLTEKDTFKTVNNALKECGIKPLF